MARPVKDGLRYFPLDVEFFEDRKVRRLRGKYGADGVLLYLYMLCKVYADKGYYTSYDDDFADDAAVDIGCSAEKIGLMLHYLLSQSLLDSTLFSAVKVLSSHGIQKQFQEASKNLRRDVEVRGDVWILDPEDTYPFIKVRLISDKSGNNPSKCSNNQDKSRNNHTNETKLNETILNENNNTACLIADKSDVENVDSSASAGAEPTPPARHLTETEIWEDRIIRALQDNDPERADRYIRFADARGIKINRQDIYNRANGERVNAQSKDNQVPPGREQVSG